MTTSGMPGSWLRCYRPQPTAAVRLVCFPHAGSGAGAFRGWPELLPPSVELLAVQYPGREDRFNEPSATDLTSMADAVGTEIAEIAGLGDRPLALFGHSMGAAIAHEVALRLPDPAHLVVSAREPVEHVTAGTVHLGGDEALRAELTRLGGSSRLLFEDAELWQLMAPVIRADYRAVETYRPVPGRTLDCPVTAFAAEDDSELTLDQARAWDRSTTGRFTLRTFPGDHFYLVPQREQVLAALTECLLPAPAVR
ncbi:alpha/beta fold hydrolase [Kitasatospora sp. MAP5-34]|uniref:thioesterase II family protein n=1 Tax=Kitasatospora sp. MAP5-34 TaxID=3035102 RepID=UPI002473F069|nr:alpha/beta fold hydrolase [Kitasatospora sp. MAP5-34]MDH6577692.1 pyochelin biosynthetic protein PchC [Kitasatospora sp. MAP5-34]